jgi:hypothetical protein
LVGSALKNPSDSGSSPPPDTPSIDLPPSLRMLLDLKERVENSVINLIRFFDISDVSLAKTLNKDDNNIITLRNILYPNKQVKDSDEKTNLTSTSLQYIFPHFASHPSEQADLVFGRIVRTTKGFIYFFFSFFFLKKKIFIIVIFFFFYYRRLTLAKLFTLLTTIALPTSQAILDYVKKDKNFINNIGNSTNSFTLFNNVPYVLSLLLYTVVQTLSYVFFPYPYIFPSNSAGNVKKSSLDSPMIGKGVGDEEEEDEDYEGKDDEHEEVGINKQKSKKEKLKEKATKKKKKRQTSFSLTTSTTVQNVSSPSAFTNLLIKRQPSDSSSSLAQASKILLPAIVRTLRSLPTSSLVDVLSVLAGKMIRTLSTTFISSDQRNELVKRAEREDKIISSKNITENSKGAKKQKKSEEIHYSFLHYFDAEKIKSESLKIQPISYHDFLSFLSSFFIPLHQHALTQLELSLLIEHSFLTIYSLFTLLYKGGANVKTNNKIKNNSSLGPLWTESFTIMIRRLFVPDDQITIIVPGLDLEHPPVQQTQKISMFHRIVINILYNTIHNAENIDPVSNSYTPSSFSSSSSLHTSKLHLSTPFSSHSHKISPSLTHTSGSLCRLNRLFPPPKSWWIFIHSLLILARDLIPVDSLYKLAIGEISRVCNLSNEMHDIMWCLFVNDLKWDALCQDIFSDGNQQDVVEIEKNEVMVNVNLETSENKEAVSDLKVKIDEQLVENYQENIEKQDHERVEQQNEEKIVESVTLNDVIKPLTVEKKEVIVSGKAINNQQIPLLPTPSYPWGPNSTKILNVYD